MKRIVCAWMLFAYGDLARNTWLIISIFESNQPTWPLCDAQLRGPERKNMPPNHIPADPIYNTNVSSSHNMLDSNCFGNVVCYLKHDSLIVGHLNGYTLWSIRVLTFTTKNPCTTSLIIWYDNRRYDWSRCFRPGIRMNRGSTKFACSIQRWFQ